MTKTEDRLRAALDAAAHTVEPDALAPLTAPGRSRRTAAWAVPVAAAATLLLVIAGAAALGGGMDGRDPGRALAGDGPRYLLTLRGGGTAVVRDPDGRELGRVRPARGEYVAVAAAKRDTFILAARTGDCGVRLYRTSIGAGGAPSRPEPLPGGTLPVSPDDVRLAVAPDGVRVAVSGTCETTYRVAVVDAGTGGRREWTGSTTAHVGYVPAWSPDGRSLAVLYWDVRRELTDAPLLMLDTDGPGGRDLSEARVLRELGFAPKGTRIESVAFAADGRTLYALLYGDGPGAVVPISSATGDPVGRPIELPSGSALAIKPDASRRHFLLIGDGWLGRIDDRGRFTRISEGTEYFDAAW